MKNHYRPPVVVVLGHVDHGKTTLLDYIRKSQKAKREVGGITQSIGAYEVTLPIKGYHTDKITFIDTPGHEAFTKLRLGGVTVADIAILVIDGVDSVMPQTKESIFHIREAKIPFIVAVNKTDLPQANIDKVKKDLLKEDVQVEGLGGTVPVLPISAKSGTGVADLLEAILLVTSEQNLTYDPEGELLAPIIEVIRDKSGTGVATIIKNGTLRVGDTVYAGELETKVRALLGDTGEKMNQVQPSTPFLLLGFTKEPEVGRSLTRKPVIGEEKALPEAKVRPNMFVEEEKKLKIILKVESQGSLEAITASLAKSENVELTLAAVGQITKSDIFLAKVTGALIIGFAVSADRQVEEVAKQEKVIIRTYNIIYELLEELTEVSDLMAEKEAKEKSLKGEGKIVATFVVDSERIAGISVTKGKIATDDMIELFRSGRPAIQSKIVSIRQRAKSVREIKKGEEAGMLLEGELDFAVGDVVKSYSI